MIVNILLSILLGMIPEGLFFTLFLIYTKNLKDKRIKLFLLISLAYILCMFINRYKIIYYIFFIIFIYIILKYLYKNKTQIIDIFVISIIYLYLTLISVICFSFVKEELNNYWIAMIINRLMLIIPFIFKNKFNFWYKRYCGLWNRNDKVKKPIKSITLRNISLIILNFLIFIINIICFYINGIKW